MEKHNDANEADEAKQEAECIVTLASVRDGRDEIIARLNDALRDLDDLFREDQAA